MEVFRLESEEQGEQQIALDVREARCIASRLREILDGHHEERYPGLQDKLRRKERAVGILFRRRTKQKVYEQALREYGVPYVVARGRGFFSRQEILDIRNALQVLADPRQDIPLVGLLRSPFFSASDVALVHLSRAEGEGFFQKLYNLDIESLSPDDQRSVEKARHLLEDWRSQLRDLRPSELILHLIRTSGILAPLSRGSDGPQRVSNVYKLLDIAREFEREGPNTLVDFADFLHTQISEEEEEAEADLPEGGGVQIMTVHQAKGLEFPLVIIPDMVYSFRGESGILVEHLGDSAQVGWICARDDRENEPTAIHQLLQAQIWKATVAEERRLLYVAQTRARDHLWMMVREPKEGKEPQNLESARSWNEWVWLQLDDPSFCWVETHPVEAGPVPEAHPSAEPVRFDVSRLSYVRLGE